MFGKKKNKDESAASESQPVEKAAKSKSKSKGNFDAKEFMLYHAEKFVFALIALLSAGLVYLGFSTKGFDANKQPSTLSATSEPAALRKRQSSCS